MKIALLCNRNAARGRSGLERVTQEAESAKISVAFTRSLAELDQILARLLETNPEVVCFAGGDGTLAHGVNALVRVASGKNLPIVTTIGGGTMNVVARWLGWKKRPLANWQRLLKLDESKIITRPMLAVEEDKVKNLAFIFSAGILPMLIERYMAKDPTWWRALALFGETWGRGALGHGLLAPRAILTDQHGTRVTARFPIILASTVPKIIFDFEPYPEPPSHDRFSLLAIRAPFTQVARRLPLLLWGRLPPNDPRYTGQITTKFGLKTAGAYVLDGELYPRSLKPREITVDIGPTIRLLSPVA